MDKIVEDAKNHFEKIVKEQLERVERMKKAGDWVDYTTIRPIIIGLVGGDGIGPYITKHAQSILEFLLKEEVENGDVELRVIEGLTIENRAKVMQAIPDDGNVTFYSKDLQQLHVKEINGQTLKVLMLLCDVH